MKASPLAILGIAFGLLALPHGLAAQPPVPPGLMPGAMAPATLSNLDLHASVSGGYDLNGTGSVPLSNLQSPLVVNNSANLGGSAQLQYSTTPGRRTEFSAHWGSSFRLYQGARVVPISHASGISVSTGLTPHLSLHGSVTGSYSPRYQYNLLPGIGGPPTLGQPSLQPTDYAITIDHVFTYWASGGASYNPTKRLTFVGDYSYRDMNANSLYYAGRVQDAAGTIHYGIAKNLSVRLGYRYQESRYTDPATGAQRPVRTGNIDAGLDYGRTGGFQLSRTTTLTFGVGTGAFSNGYRTEYRVTGQVYLAHELSRSWQAGLAYNRGVNFVDGITAPLLTDSVSARLNGQLSRRYGAYVSLGYSHGTVEDIHGSSPYHSYQGLVGVQGMLTRQLSFFVQYFNYFHDFDQFNTFLVPGAPALLHRQGIRTGLTYHAAHGPAANSAAPADPVD